jgi:hypothetical protein
MKARKSPIKVSISKDSEGQWFVSPPSIRLERGEEAVFSVKSGRAVIFIPRPELFEDGVTEEGEDHSAPGEALRSDKGIIVRVSKGKPSKVTARRPKKAKALRAKARARASKAELVTLPYAVYCEGATDFARGNSMPVMIIDPPDNGISPTKGIPGAIRPL